MAIYTVAGSDDLDRKIEADLQRIAALAAPHSRAGILLGGYGRGEGTPFVNSDGSQAPFNDYDLVVVVDRADRTVRETFRALEKKLTAQLGLTVDLCPYQRDRLPRCEFSLLNYEMKYGHRVIWGDEHPLAAMPDYPHNAIPLSEGLRLLLNRGKLLLDIRGRLGRPDALSEQERIRFIKFISKAWLALGDCALLAERKYSISYQEKRRLITSIGCVPQRARVIDEYLDAITLKEQGDYLARLPDYALAEQFGRARDLFLEFFCWYRTQASGREGPVWKSMLQNLQWNHWPYPAHPRRRLYDALPELLKNHPDQLLLGQMLCCSRNPEERFYELQARFS